MSIYSVCVCACAQACVSSHAHLVVCHSDVFIHPQTGRQCEHSKQTQHSLNPHHVCWRQDSRLCHPLPLHHCGLEDDTGRYVLILL